MYAICVLSAALAACQGVGCMPWRRLGAAALPVEFPRDVRRLLLAKGLDVRPGVALASSGHRRSAGSICVLCAAVAACQGVGCTPWRRAGVVWAPPLCR